MLKTINTSFLFDLIKNKEKVTIILKGIKQQSWRKEKIDDTLSRLHRLTEADFDKDSILMIHEYDDQFLDEFDSLFEN